MTTDKEKSEPTSIILSNNQKKLDENLEPQRTKYTPIHRLYRPNTKKLKGGQITISSGLSWYLKLHSRRWKPAESCAMLFGFKDDKAKKFDIRGAVLCSNPTHSGGYFEMPPIEIIKSYEIAKKYGMEIVGVFHSHPSGFEIPSNTDEKFMEITPGAWIIYSWTALRCYTLKKGRFGVPDVRELTVKEQRTKEKPIIVHAYDWKKTKFPPKFNPFRWKQLWKGPTVIPIHRISEDKIWPPDWGDTPRYGIY